MKADMIAVLDKFFAEKTIQDVDRNTFLVCNLEDKQAKINISLIFMRDWDSIEADSYNSVILENTGAIFIFPCYWISVPKPLAMAYIQWIIDDFYENTVASWNTGSGTGGSNNSGASGNGGCNGNNRPCPPCSINI